MEDNEENIDRRVRNNEVYRKIANERNKITLKKVSIKILKYVFVITLFELAIRCFEHT